MIDLTIRKLTMLKEPSKSVGKMFFRLDGYKNIAIVLRSSSICSRWNLILNSNLPDKFSSFFVVFKNLANVCKINIAHAVVPLKQWYVKWVTGTAIPVTCDFTRRSVYGQC